jgi:DNA-binding transcriptional ArsR family regulator
MDGPDASGISVPLDLRIYFVYGKSMDVRRTRVRPGGDVAISAVAAAIGEPARARMLCCLMDGHARTSTELAVFAEVSPSTASVHLNRLTTERLVKKLVQGRHHFYSLGGPAVASAIEALSVLVGASRSQFVPTTPSRLRAARTCYDHLAGSLGVALHDRLLKLSWMTAANGTSYEVSMHGAKAFAALGVDMEATRALRRRFACACLDWSERRPHVGGALGAALLKLALKRRWVVQDADSRALRVTSTGRREMLARLGLQL